MHACREIGDILATYRAQPQVISGELNLLGENEMNEMMMKYYIKMQNLLNSEDGQDLIEYALLASLLAVAAVAVLNPLATAVNGAFTAATTAVTGAK
jgi:pilus assembly protein Flp/PilA